MTCMLPLRNRNQEDDVFARWPSPESGALAGLHFLPLAL